MFMPDLERRSVVPGSERRVILKPGNPRARWGKIRGIHGADLPCWADWGQSLRDRGNLARI
ncbi:MAG: hypothetical protein Alpg2KO_07020 [Alphaproteobacteria bacterium]